LTKSGFRVAALVFLAVLFATNIYRAATQSIVHDEALTWQLYLAGPASTIFQNYDANNHFLATVLFRISTTLFGVSEFAMRLPTLLAGAWFFWTIFQLCGLVFGDGWLFLLGCATLTLNPFLLDFLVAARGYGLAMAGLFWALFQMLAWFKQMRLDERSRGAGFEDSDVQLRKRLWKAALGCSIAVAANLTLLMPVFVLAAAFCLLIRRTREKPSTGSPQVLGAPSKTRKKGKKRKPEGARDPAGSFTPLMHFVVPVIVLAVAFLLAAPIDTARSGDFYVGTSAAIDSLRSLISVSFAYGSGPGALYRVEQIWKNIALIFLPVIALAALIMVSMTGRQRSTVELGTWLASLAVVGSAILLAGAHFLAGLPYPENRTGIYFVPLASFAALGLVRILMERRPGLPRWIGGAVAVVLVSFAVEFAAQWNVSSFLVWRYDADTKRIFKVLEAAPRPSGPIRLGASWTLEPALNYYRDVRKASWMDLVVRDGFDGARQFYVVTVEDPTAPWPKLQQIYKGPVSGTVLAIPQTAQ
jgi:hypothetical protein